VKNENNGKGMSGDIFRNVVVEDLAVLHLTEEHVLQGESVGANAWDGTAAAAADARVVGFICVGLLNGISVSDVAAGGFPASGFVDERHDGIGIGIGIDLDIDLDVDLDVDIIDKPMYKVSRSRGEYEILHLF